MVGIQSPAHLHRWHDFGKPIWEGKADVTDELGSLSILRSPLGRESAILLRDAMLEKCLSLLPRERAPKGIVPDLFLGEDLAQRLEVLGRPEAQP